MGASANTLDEVERAWDDICCEGGKGPCEVVEASDNAGGGVGGREEGVRGGV
jgi:hypothetical protein